MSNAVMSPVFRHALGPVDFKPKSIPTGAALIIGMERLMAVTAVAGPQIRTVTAMILTTANMAGARMGLSRARIILQTVHLLHSCKLVTLTL